jgi:hypothetical protein
VAIFKSAGVCKFQIVAAVSEAKATVSVATPSKGVGTISIPPSNQTAAISSSPFVGIASAAFLNAARRSMHAIREAVGVGTVDPASLRAAERRQHSGWLLRDAENASILALVAQGMAIKEIMRRVDKSRGTPAAFTSCRKPIAPARTRSECRNRTAHRLALVSRDRQRTT